MAEATSPRVQRRREATRARIFDVAMRLFIEQGIEATTVAQITEAADIGKGTFFTYFPTKYDVVFYLGEQVLQAVIDADAPTLTAPRRLHRAFDSAADWFEQNEAHARQLCLARLAALPMTSSSPNRARAAVLLREVVQAGIDAGDFRPIPPQDAVTALGSAFSAPLALWALDPESPPLRQRLHAQLDIVLAGLAPRP